MQVTAIGIDLAKTVFQVHAVDADGATVVRKRLRRAEVLSFVSGLEPCLIGMEARATSHYRGTIGGSRADRDYRMSTYDKA
jgi:transposase